MYPKARVYKLTNSRNTVYTWVSILPSGTFGVFTTWGEALEFLGARMESAE